MSLRPLRRIGHAATRWYEERRPGLGGEFHEAVVRAIALIEAHPEIGSLSAVQVPTRELTLARFPYKIVYRVRSDDRYVVAVSHAKRRPQDLLRPFFLLDSPVDSIGNALT